jgi:hypothetical protein
LAPPHLSFTHRLCSSFLWRLIEQVREAQILDNLLSCIAFLVIIVLRKAITISQRIAVFVHVDYRASNAHIRVDN